VSLGVSITERILRRGASAPAADGSAYCRVEPDLVLGHEATIALLIDRLRKTGRPVWNPDKCFFAADHFAPPATAERAGILRKYLDFVDAEGISKDQLYRGISHQLLVEDARCVPGALIAGADSHTTMAGALGCFAAGFGSTDILSVLATGNVFVSIPRAVHVRLVGQLGEWVSGKDVALAMMRHFGEGGARYAALEFSDETSGMELADRMAVTNMAVDCGAKNGVFAPDATTRAWLTARDGVDPGDLSPWAIGNASAYAEEVVIDVGALRPLIARPGSPADVVEVREAGSERVHQVFIGSCCGGRVEDIRAAVEVLNGRRVHPDVRMVVTPASQQVYRDAVEEGLVTKLIDAGAMVTASACGACGGIDKGILADREVCVSTSNRNFRGRMGSNDARIYLASAATAAAAAITGTVADPAGVS
jgi:3-isopropylmalate/(R)-2-methylmalate dehydratase large subunit